ncbi:MAG: hypothetical protein IJX76_05530 [Clostridia bacterium]|nr:hypothetical protein [Clostridia bacterium]
MTFRTIRKLFLAIVCFMLCFLCLSGAVTASENSPRRGYLLGEDEAEYRSQIEQSLRKEEDSIREDIRKMVNLAYGYQIETDTVFVEYEMDYRALREFGTDESSSFLPASYADKPIFLTPLIGKIGEEMRIFGYIGFHRTSDDVYPTERWVTRVDEDFQKGERHHYLELLTDDELLSRLLSEKGAGEAQEIVLVRTLVGDSVNRVAMVKAEGGVFVWDLNDQVLDGDETVLYEVEEFIALQDDKEEKRAEGFWEAVKDTLLTISATLLGTLLLVVAGIALLIVVIVLIVRKLIRKRRAARGE